jgi:hypothetical protein
MRERAQVQAKVGEATTHLLSSRQRCLGTQMFKIQERHSFEYELHGIGREGSFTKQYRNPSDFSAERRLTVSQLRNLATGSSSVPLA